MPGPRRWNARVSVESWVGSRGSVPVRRYVELQTVSALRAAGRSWREIAIALKVPTRTLHRAWQNPPPAQAA